MANALLHGTSFTPCLTRRNARVCSSHNRRAVVRAAAKSAQDLGFKTMRKGVKEVLPLLSRVLNRLRLGVAGFELPEDSCEAPEPKYQAERHVPQHCSSIRTPAAVNHGTEVK